MGGASKRLDLCLGEFAVSIQGYDDPVAVLRDVLELSQRVMAETPELLENQAVFDEATMTAIIERVASRNGADPDSFGALPGLVLVHLARETDGGLETIRHAADAAMSDTVVEAAEEESVAPADPAEEDELFLDDPITAGEGRPGAETACADAEDALEAPSWDDAEIEPEDETEPEPPRPSTGFTLGEGPASGLDAYALRARMRAKQATGSFDPAGGESDRPGTDDGKAIVNIFDTPADGALESPRGRPLFPRRGAGDGDRHSGPADMPEAPDRHVEGGILGDRFEHLLKRVHGKDVAEDAPATRRRAMDATALARLTPADVAGAAGVEDANDALLSAAAFLTVVRRQTRFSRKELMAVFNEVPGEFPRTLESQIKGIGKLVRKGSLKQAEDGQYSLERELIEKFENILQP